MNKKNIAQSFGKAASSYDQEAPVQQRTAHLVRDYVARLNVRPDATCLEIGCGTGFLTQEMLQVLPKAEWTITDLSQDMLSTCEARIGAGPKYVVMDGEHPNVRSQYDLIVTSLAVQWFHDLYGGLQRLTELLKPSGHLVFSTLGQNSFSQWRENLQRLQKPVGLHIYPTCDEMNGYQFDQSSLNVETHTYMHKYESGLHFLRSLKTIGAQEPKSGYVSMSACDMRQVLRSFEGAQTGCEMTYEILLGDICKGRDQ